MGIGMRKKYIQLTEYLTDKDPRVVTLLGDIGVFSFKPTKDKHPNRVHNLGICEPAMISIAAGLALEGFIPFVHTIAPFIVERPYEQLKDDFGYQGLGGNFISIGASYDDGGLGTTHYCPGDVAVLKAIPEFKIMIPGTEHEMEALICDQYDNGKPNYFRLSTQSNRIDYAVEFGKACVLKQGKLATVIAIGPMLDTVLDAVADLDVTVLYYTTVEPFDRVALNQNCPSRKVLLCEPYYYGVLTTDVIESFKGAPVQISHVGVPYQFMTTYGTREQNDEQIGISVKSIREKLIALIAAP